MILRTPEREGRGRARSKATGVILSRVLMQVRGAILLAMMLGLAMSRVDMRAGVRGVGLRGWSFPRRIIVVDVGGNWVDGLSRVKAYGVPRARVGMAVMHMFCVESRGVSSERAGVLRVSDVRVRGRGRFWV